MNREREGAYLHHFSDFLCSKLDDEAGSTFEGYTGTPSEEYRVRSPTEQRDAGGALTERLSWQPCTDINVLVQIQLAIAQLDQGIQEVHRSIE